MNIGTGLVLWFIFTIVIDTFVWGVSGAMALRLIFKNKKISLILGGLIGQLVK